MPSTNSYYNPSSDKTTVNKYKNELCPNILDISHNNNARLPKIKIIYKNKLSDLYQLQLLYPIHKLLENISQ